MAKQFRYKTDQIVRMKNHPDKDMVVMKQMYSHASKAPMYQVRFADSPNDLRGFIVWDDDLL